MAAQGIGWMGIQTPSFDEMERFLAAVIGAGPATVEPGFRLWSLPNGDLVELFAPGSKPTFGAGPTVGFLVDDLDRARDAVEAAGGTVVSGYGPNEDGYVAIHVGGPDGNVYELINDPQHEERGSGV